MSTEGKFHFRFAKKTDADLYYEWANDELVRQNSFKQDKISFEEHVRWFESKLNSENCFLYLFLDEMDNAAGQIRIDKNNNEVTIGISIDKKFRGQSLGVEMLNQATADYLKKEPKATIVAYIKPENLASLNIFRKAGFTNEEIVKVGEGNSYKLYKRSV